MSADEGRRSFLRGAIAALATAPVTAAASTASTEPKPAAQPPAEGAPKGKPARLPERTRRWGMAIDLDRCTACGSCTVACRQENNVPVYGASAAHASAQPEWISLLWLESDQPGGLPQVLPFPCQHCEDAPCVKACPVGATYKENDGITMQIWDRCIGCRYCMVACPYSRRSFNWEAPRWEGSLVQMLNPDVATRPMGVVEKCTFCHHRLRRTHEECALDGREPTDDELRRLPACAAACPASAMIFGDLEDPNSAVAEAARSPRVFRLLEHLGTKPGVFYLKRDRR